MKRVQSYGKHEDIVLRAHIELSRSLTKIRTKETAWLADRDLTLPQFGILETDRRSNNDTDSQYTR
jgi:hypothetical protein